MRAGSQDQRHAHPIVVKVPDVRRAGITFATLAIDRTLAQTHAALGTAADALGALPAVQIEHTRLRAITTGSVHDLFAAEGTERQPTRAAASDAAAIIFVGTRAAYAEVRQGGGGRITRV